jgi:hypothetical protein
MVLLFLSLLLLSLLLSAAAALVATQCRDELQAAIPANGFLLAGSLLVSFALLFRGATTLWLQLSLLVLLLLGLLRFSPALLFPFLLAPLLLLAALDTSWLGIAAVAALLMGSIAFGYLSLRSKKLKGERWFSAMFRPLKLLVIPVAATSAVILVIYFLLQ